MRRYSPSMAFILVTIIIDMLGVGLAYPLLPKLIESLSGGTISDAAFLYGLIATVYALAQFLFSPVMGSLSDAYGRRPILLMSQAGLAFDYMIMAFAPNLWWLAAARLVSGILGGSISTANAYIADVSTPENRARNFGLLGAAFGIGFVLGPVIGGFLGEIDIRYPFFAAAALGALNVTFGYFILPESLKLENRRPFQGVLKNNPFKSLLTIRKHPAIAPLFLALMATMLSQRGLEATWILFVNFQFGWGIRDAALSLAFVGVVSVLMQGGIVGFVVKRFGENRAMIGGYAICIVALFLLSIANQGWMVFPLIAAQIFGNTCAEPSLRSVLSRNMPANEQGFLQGIIASLNGVVIIIGPLVASMLLSNTTGPNAFVPLPGVWFLIGSGLYLVAFLLVSRRQVV